MRNDALVRRSASDYVLYGGVEGSVSWALTEASCEPIDDCADDCGAGDAAGAEVVVDGLDGVFVEGDCEFFAAGYAFHGIGFLLASVGRIVW